MAEKTEIAWTDSTFNPWWGCSKVGPGCDHCYAEALDKRTGGNHWGTTKTPRVMSADNWRKPAGWQRIAEATGMRRRVFCGSMCDWADKNAPTNQRARLWALIQATPMLDWQLLTKRAPNIARCLPDYDPPSVYREKEVIARRPYTCCECGEIIQKGEMHQYVFGVWDGCAETYRTCEKCADLRESLIEAGVCPAFGDLKREHFEFLENGSDDV